MPWRRRLFSSSLSRCRFFDPIAGQDNPSLSIAADAVDVVDLAGDVGRMLNWSSLIAIGDSGETASDSISNLDRNFKGDV